MYQGLSLHYVFTTDGVHLVKEVWPSGKLGNARQTSFCPVLSLILTKVAVALQRINQRMPTYEIKVGSRTCYFGPVYYRSFNHNIESNKIIFLVVNNLYFHSTRILTISQNILQAWD